MRDSCAGACNGSLVPNERIASKAEGAVRAHQRKSRPFAKQLRKKLTDAERILWSRLRQQSLHGRKFRRQHPIGPYIADFACIQLWLVVEVDGATHGTDSEIAHDIRRDAYMRSLGWMVLRIINEDVYKNLDNVLERILSIEPPPRPSGGPPP